MIAVTRCPAMAPQRAIEAVQRAALPFSCEYICGITPTTLDTVILGINSKVSALSVPTWLEFYRDKNNRLPVQKHFK